MNAENHKVGQIGCQWNTQFEVGMAKNHFALVLSLGSGDHPIDPLCLFNLPMPLAQ